MLYLLADSSRDSRIALPRGPPAWMLGLKIRIDIGSEFAIQTRNAIAFFLLIIEGHVHTPARVTFLIWTVFDVVILMVARLLMSTALDCLAAGGKK